MIIPVSVKNQSIDSSGITSDYKAAISEYIWNGFEANATKVSIEYTHNEAFGVKELIIKDNGEGIKKEDLPRIFERGYTGSNHRNNQYKSTGFGLYMVDLILKRLGHDCYVESSFSKYTRFIIVFKDNRDFFNL